MVRKSWAIKIRSIERRLDFVPEVSALEQETIQIDPDTRDMLESLGFGSLNGVAVNSGYHRD